MISPWLIAIDMDGTLLRRDHTIGTATKAAIQQALAQGHIVAIATGRPPRAALKAYHELQLTTPLIALNGAYIRLSERPDDILKTTIPRDMVDAIGTQAIALGAHAMLAEFGSHCVIRQNDQAFFSDEDEETFFYQAVVAESPEEPPIIQPLFTDWRDDAYALLIQLPTRERQALTEWIEAKWPKQIFCRSWREPFHMLEILAGNVNKATGLQKIQSFYHIPKERVLVFGDEMNDLQMFKYAAISVAMGNANPNLVPYADAVTSDCDEDGIAEYLNRHFFPAHILS